MGTSTRRFVPHSSVTELESMPTCAPFSKRCTSTSTPSVHRRYAAVSPARPEPTTATLTLGRDMVAGGVCKGKEAVKTPTSIASRVAGRRRRARGNRSVWALGSGR